MLTMNTSTLGGLRRNLDQSPSLSWAPVGSTSQTEGLLWVSAGCGESPCQDSHPWRHRRPRPAQERQMGTARQQADRL